MAKMQLKSSTMDGENFENYLAAGVTKSGKKKEKYDIKK